MHVKEKKYAMRKRVDHSEDSVQVLVESVPSKVYLQAQAKVQVQSVQALYSSIQFALFEYKKSSEQNSQNKM